MFNDKSQRLTDEQLSNWLALANSCTEGPWFVHTTHWKGCFIAYGDPNDNNDTYDLYESYNWETDYRLMAESREAIPALIAEIEALKIELAEARRQEGYAKADLAMRSAISSARETRLKAREDRVFGKELD